MFLLSLNSFWKIQVGYGKQKEWKVTELWMAFLPLAMTNWWPLKNRGYVNDQRSRFLKSVPCPSVLRPPSLTPNRFRGYNLESDALTLTEVHSDKMPYEFWCSFIWALAWRWLQFNSLRMVGPFGWTINNKTNVYWMLVLGIQQWI